MNIFYKTECVLMHKFVCRHLKPLRVFLANTQWQGKSGGNQTFRNSEHVQTGIGGLSHFSLSRCWSVQQKSSTATVHLPSHLPQHSTGAWTTAKTHPSISVGTHQQDRAFLLLTSLLPHVEGRRLQLTNADGISWYVWSMRLGSPSDAQLQGNRCCAQGVQVQVTTWEKTPSEFYQLGR